MQIFKYQLLANKVFRYQGSSFESEHAMRLLIGLLLLTTKEQQRPNLYNILHQLRKGKFACLADFTEFTVAGHSAQILTHYFVLLENKPNMAYLVRHRLQEFLMDYYYGGA